MIRRRKRRGGKRKEGPDELGGE